MIEKRNLSEQVYFYLRKKIISNELTPGSRVNYDDIISELGISKTPVRDALYLLQQDGLVEIKERSGTFVNTPKVQDVKEVYDIRNALERQAVNLAMENMTKADIEKMLNKAIKVEETLNDSSVETFVESDREFHRTLILWSKNQRLIKLMESLDAQLQWISVITATSSERPKETNAMHKRIIAAMLHSNKKIAQDLMEEHIEEAKQITLKEFI
ncbi:GntR family transcriptional regulator [Alkalihalobacterium alkalinitrilicum]|uniref:GntR family transcriptional regulator n=1 Tax=Alkalihalobacterium alkalinitrilicum TaxID=427920 RepID=UPI000994F867|nr:GntR family transcriptional regulator [Alkalihalobacterium alkalinitrilicum]